MVSRSEAVQLDLFGGNCGSFSVVVDNGVPHLRRWYEPMRVVNEPTPWGAAQSAPKSTYKVYADGARHRIALPKREKETRALEFDA
jgi:hypothetical protein